LTSQGYWQKYLSEWEKLSHETELQVQAKPVHLKCSLDALLENEVFTKLKVQIESLWMPEQTEAGFDTVLQHVRQQATIYARERQANPPPRCEETEARSTEALTTYATMSQPRSSILALR